MLHDNFEALISAGSRSLSGGVERHKATWTFDPLRPLRAAAYELLSPFEETQERTQLRASDECESPVQSFLATAKASNCETTRVSHTCYAFVQIGLEVHRQTLPAAPVTAAIADHEHGRFRLAANVAILVEDH